MSSEIIRIVHRSQRRVIFVMNSRLLYRNNPLQLPELFIYLSHGYLSSYKIRFTFNL